MAFEDLPIRRKVTTVIVLVSLVVLLLAIGALYVFDTTSYRGLTIRQIESTAALVMDASRPVLNYDDPADARRILSLLHISPHITAAALYDTNGKIFVYYPSGAVPKDFPATAPPAGRQYSNGRLLLSENVKENGRVLGTLLFSADLSNVRDRSQVYGGVALLVLLGSLVAALLLSRAVEAQVTRPVLGLVKAAEAVSQEGNFSLRAPAGGGDEVGRLIAAFNRMLDKIEVQTRALQQNQEELRLALQASRTGIWDWDLGRNLVSWDDTVKRLLNLSATQGSLDDFLSGVYAADRMAIAYAITQAVEKRSEFLSEFRAQGPDQPVRYLITRGKVFTGTEGEATRTVGILIDATENRQSEESHAFLASIIDSSDAAVIGLDLRDEVLSWNHAAEKLYGYTAAEMVGKTLEVLRPPEVREKEQRLVAEVKLGQSHLFEGVQLNRQGEPLEVSLNIFPIRSPRGEIAGYAIIVRDIRERKQAERNLIESRARLSGIIDSAMDAIISVDAHQRITMFNRAAERMFRCTADQIIGKSLDHLIPARYRDMHRHHVDDFGHTGVTSRAMGSLRPLSALRGDGTEFPIEASISQISVGTQKIYTVILRDITERTKAQEALEKQTAALHEQAQELEQRVRQRTAALSSVNQELEAFTYSVAHDLRAPIRHIVAFAGILQEDFGSTLPPEAQSYLENIRRSSGNMSRLVEDLLNLARVRRQEVQRMPIPLRDLVDQVISESGRETSGRNIEWIIGELPVIEGDASLMKQVLVNLISNAIKYTRPKPRARIEIGTREEKGETVVFVRDNGVGFDMKYSDKLFGVFQRLHRTEEFEGTGVGLAIVERVIHKHGGRVWAHGQPGQGATFSFTVQPHHG